MDYLIFLYIIPLSLIIIWCTTRAMRRMKKRKAYGEKLLIVKDITSNMDLFLASFF